MIHATSDLLNFPHNCLPPFLQGSKSGQWTQSSHFILTTLPHIKIGQEIINCPQKPPRYFLFQICELDKKTQEPPQSYAV